MRVTAVVLTKNEAVALPRALASLPPSMPVLVIDAESSDGTVAVARELGATTIVRPWEGFVAARRFAAGAVATPWMLMIDADERLDGTQRAALASLPDEPAHAGFRLARTTYLCGRPVYGCGWGEERLLRLMRRDGAVITAAPVTGGGAELHERWTVAGSVGDLPGTMAHDSYPTLGAYFQKFDRYTTLEAASLERRAGRPLMLLRSLGLAILRALWLLLGRGGWRDGWRGFFVSAASAAYPVAVRWKARGDRERRPG